MKKTGESQPKLDDLDSIGYNIIKYATIGMMAS